MIVRNSFRLEGHHPITRVGRVHVPEQGFVLIPDTRYNILERHGFIPGKLEDVPKGNRIMDRLVAGLVKRLEDAGIDDQMRKGGRPTRKGQRSTSPGAGAAGSPVDLVREQRGEEGATRKKAFKGASGDPLDVDSGGSEQAAPKGKKKASANTRKTGGKKKPPAKTKKTAGKKKMSEPESDSKSESETTTRCISAKRKMTPEQRKKLTEMSQSTCPDRIKERNAAFAAADEVSRKREAKLLKRKKAEAKSAAVAARKKAAATLDPSAGKSKTSLNKAAPGTKKPVERAAPAAANLDSSKNDQAGEDPVSTSPPNKSKSEQNKTRDDTTSTNGLESGDSEEDVDESVDDLEDARAEPHGDLESDDSQGAGDSKADEASLKVMREWRAALYRLRNTRIEGVNAAITTIQNDSKDGDGNVVKALVRNPMLTAKRWLVQLAAVDVCHDDTCCPETKLLKDAFKTHPIEAGDTEEPVASAKPKSAKRKGGKTKRKRSK
ncbi:unnamed protein product [Ectocarpus sp. 12 AP-2014]